MEPRPNHQFDPFSINATQFDMDHGEPHRIDWNNPASFFEAVNLPTPKIVSADEVRREAKSMSLIIFSKFDVLRSILNRHEAIIQKRWLKKTKGQRSKVLLAAWPGMPALHRPDFEAFRRENERQREVNTQYRDAFMWPYINQEDLTKTRTLLLLLNARGRHKPGDFAMADTMAMHLGIVTKAVVPVFLNEYVMMFTGRSNPSAYGELIAWDDHPDAFNWMHTRKGLLPGEGLLTLEAQQRTLTFLVNCCEQILHDIPQNSLTSDNYPVLPEPPSLLENDTIGIVSLVVMTEDAPYRPPAHLDFGRIETLLSAKVSAAEDHLWSLREDPGYFADCLLDMKEHRQEVLQDLDGKSHPIFQPHREDVFWGRVVGEVLSSAYLGLELWSELHEQVTKLQKLQEHHASQIAIQDDLPEEYLDALLKFQHYLTQAAKGSLGQLKHVVVASPPIRAFFVREPPQDPNSPKIRVMQRPGRKLDKVQYQVIWLLRTLWEDGYELFLMRMPLVADELERLVQSDARAREMISPYVATVIGDLAVIAECLRQIDIYQPWAQTFEHHMVDKKDGIEKGFAERSQPWSKILSALQSSRESVLSRLGAPSGKRFFYPIHKRKTAENVQAIRQAEQNLDIFWAKVDQLMRDRAGNLDGTAVRRLLSEARDLQRTPEWVEPVKAVQSPESDNAVKTLSRPLSELYFVLESRTEHTTDRSITRLPKLKAKTVGTARPQPQRTHPGPAMAPDSFDLLSTIDVDNRALKVFRTLFFTPSVTATPGEVLWKDFLHAMVSTGFVPEKLYGSVWQFSPTRLVVERSIHFHEPHDPGKIPYRKARNHGRRLSRAYGWHGGMFVLAEK